MACIRIPTSQKKYMPVVATYFLFNLLCFLQMYSIGIGALAVTLVLVGLGCLVRFELMGVYVFTALPFFNVMNSSVGSTSLFYLLLGVTAVRYLIQGFERSTPIKISLLLLIVVVTCSNLNAQMRYLQWLIRLTPLVLFYNSPFIKNKLSQIIDAYAISLVVASLWGHLMLKAGTSIYTRNYVYAEGTSTTRLAGLVGDSVMYAIQLLFLISLLFVLMIKKRERRSVRCTLIVVLVVFGLLTYSKTFLGCLLLQLLFVYVYQVRQTRATVKSLLRDLLVVSVILAVMMGVLYYIFTAESLWATNIRTRLLAADLSTGRLTVWKYYLDWFMEDVKNIIFGMGFAEYAVRRTFHSPSGGVFNILYAHNIFLETAVVFGGVIAFLLLVILIIWMEKTYRKHRGVLIFLPLFVFLTVGMISHGHFEYSTYLNLLLILMVADGDGFDSKSKEQRPSTLEAFT